MSNVTPLQRWPDLQEQFNRRQMNGQPCDDLIDVMLKELPPHDGRRRETDDAPANAVAARKA